MRLQGKRFVGLVIAMFACILAMKPSMAQNSSKKIFQTAENASEGCTLVALDGSFVSNPSGALDRINAIRYEACTEGVKDPRDTARSLTPQDYVPIKWSSSLEYIARVRAAEASICTSHTRPNGDSCFATEAPDGLHSYGEVLAWNFSNNLIYGINQWYAEKTDWVNNTGGVTGHYTQMIDPSNTYVGIGCFLYDGGIYYNTTSGEFSDESVLTSNFLGAEPDCRVIIEIQRSALSGVRLIKTDEKLQQEGYLDQGDMLSYALGMTATFDGEQAYVLDAGNIHWTSSVPSVASADGYGNVRITNVGNVIISAASDSGLTASLTLSPAHRAGEWTVQSQASKAQDGKRVKKCSICGELVQEEIILRLGEIRLSAEEFTYDGKAKKPSVIIRDSSGASVKAGNYKLSYKKNKNVGNGEVNIKFRNEYAGSETLSLLIRPQKVTGLKAKGEKKSLRLTWKKRSKQVSGYEIEYSLKKDFSGSKITAVKKSSTVSKTLKKLKAKKTYYVRIRSYYKVGGKKYVSLWSKTVKIKTRKT